MRLLGICFASFSSGNLRTSNLVDWLSQIIITGLGELTTLQLSTTYTPSSVGGHSIGYGISHPFLWTCSNFYQILCLRDRGSGYRWGLLVVGGSKFGCQNRHWSIHCESIRIVHCGGAHQNIRSCLLLSPSHIITCSPIRVFSSNFLLTTIPNLQAVRLYLMLPFLPLISPTGMV